MELQLILIATRLIDISTVTLNTVNHIMVVEQGGGILEKESLFETKWTLYTHKPSKDGWTSKVLTNTYLPRISETRLSICESTFCTVMQSNFDDALYFLKLSPNKSESTTPYVFGESLKVNLSIPSGMNVKIPNNGDWSTPFLPTNRCLFNPALLPNNSNSEVLIVANSADTRTWLFSVKDKKVAELANFENCLEPCLLDVSGTRLLLFRECPEKWPLYYNRPANRIAAELLPVLIHTLDKEYLVEDTKRDTSNGWVTGPSFVFDACIGKQNEIVLATVTGLLNKPILQILLSSDQGKTWDERASIPLKEVPYRLRVTASGLKILTAFTFKKHDGFHVMAVEIDVK